MSVVKWLVRHRWIGAWGIVGYGLAVKGYTDHPDLGNTIFSIEKPARPESIKSEVETILYGQERRELDLNG